MCGRGTVGCTLEQPLHQAIGPVLGAVEQHHQQDAAAGGVVDPGQDEAIDDGRHEVGGGLGQARPEQRVGKVPCRPDQRHHQGGEQGLILPIGGWLGEPAPSRFLCESGYDRDHQHAERPLGVEQRPLIRDRRQQLRLVDDPQRGQHEERNAKKDKRIPERIDPPADQAPPEIGQAGPATREGDDRQGRDQRSCRGYLIHQADELVRRGSRGRLGCRRILRSAGSN